MVRIVELVNAYHSFTLSNKTTLEIFPRKVIRGFPDDLAKSPQLVNGVKVGIIAIAPDYTGNTPSVEEVVSEEEHLEPKKKKPSKEEKEERTEGGNEDAG